MELILLQDIDKVGDKHSVVTVKNGFGRNYLIPQGMALIANKINRGKLDDLKAAEAAEEAKLLGHYQEMADKIGDTVLKIGAKAGTSGKIFGSITSIQIAAVLKEEFDMEIPRRKITIPVEVKELGEYEAVLTLHPEVVKTVKINVIQE